MMKKSLGQHFLTDRGIISRVVDAAEPFTGDFVLEIGPGQGALTQELLERGQPVIAIETDLSLLPYLHDTFAQQIETEQLRVIPGDIRSFDETNLRQFGSKYTIVANIPYYLTGLLFRKFLTSDFSPDKITFIIQREVADRIMMRDGKGSLLAMSVQAYGTPSYHGVIKSGSFQPAPKVDSAIITIERQDRLALHQVDAGWFFTVLRAGFGHKRKQLQNNLSDICAADQVVAALAEIDLDPKIRAESLDLSHWISLTRLLNQNQ